MNNEAPRMELKATSINSNPLGIIVYLEGIGKVDSHFSHSEDNDTGTGPHQELDNVGIGLFFLWLGHP